MFPSHARVVTSPLPPPPSPRNRSSFLCPFHIPTHLASNLATANAWIASTTAVCRLEDGELGPSTTCAAPCRRCTLLCIEAFRTPLYVPYSSSALEHCLAHSVHVYRPFCLAKSRHDHHRIIALLSPPFPLAFASNHLLRPLRIPQLFKRLARSPLISHTQTHSLSLSLPAGSRAINNRQSATPLFNFILSFLRTYTRTIGQRYRDVVSLMAGNNKLTAVWGRRLRCVTWLQ